MPQELLLQVTPEIAANELLLKEYLAKQIKVSVNEIQHVSILKRSIDARQKSIKINLKVSVYLKGEPVSFPKGRGNGKTFAAILRILLADENTFTLSEVKRSCKTNRARIYADMLLDINAKLLAAGFITNLK